jgi:hypothetical protein
MLECVQEDRNNPLPCTDEDRKKWGTEAEPAAAPTTAPAEGQTPEAAKDEDVDKLFDELVGAPDHADHAKAEAPLAAPP